MHDVMHSCAVLIAFLQVQLAAKTDFLAILLGAQIKCHYKYRSSIHLYKV